jgi:small conductance mechanosensitive channel
VGVKSDSAGGLAGAQPREEAMQATILESIGSLSDLFIIYALEVLGAILLLIGGWIVANWARRIVKRGLDGVTGLEDTIKPFISSGVRYAVLIFALFAVLAQFGVQTASIITVLATAGLAVGLALQGTLSNVASGMMLLFIRPLKAGEYIDAGGVSGTVTEVGLFVTTLTNFDGIYVAVPNSQLWGTAITNYSRLPTRMINLTVGIGYEDDIDRAQTVLRELVERDERVLGDPPLNIFVATLNSSSVDITVRCWLKREDYWDCLRQLTKDIKLSFDAASISIPYPQTDVHLFHAEDRSEAV